METKATCFFIGHHDTDILTMNELRSTIEQHIVKFGVRDFLVGHYGNFDRMTIHVLLELKRTYPEIRLTMLLPYHPLPNSPNHFPVGFDDSLYPFDRQIPPKAAIVAANKTAIRMSNYLICYVRHFGKSKDFLIYAQKREKKGLIHITNLAE